MGALVCGDVFNTSAVHLLFHSSFGENSTSVTPVHVGAAPDSHVFYHKILLYPYSLGKTCQTRGGLQTQKEPIHRLTRDHDVT